MDITSYPNGIELHLQEEPIRLLAVKQNGEYVTENFLPSPEFKNKEDSFFLQHKHLGEDVMYYHASEEQVVVLQQRLRFGNKKQNDSPDIYAILNEIEKSFEAMEQVLDGAWKNYSEIEREMQKELWHSHLLRVTDGEKMDEVMTVLPKLIKDTWQRYQRLKSAWDRLSKEKEQEVVALWEEIIRKAYKQKERTQEDALIGKTFIPVRYQSISYDVGVELVVQTSPFRHVYLKQGDQFVTHKYLTDLPLDKKMAYFLESGFNCQPVILVDCSDELVEEIKKKLKEMNESTPQILEAMTIVEAIEQDFTDRWGLRQEWESSFDSSEQNRLKFLWATKIAQEVDFGEKENAVKRVPKIMEACICEPSNLNHQWNQMDGDIQEEILQTWKNIVKENL